MPPPNVTLDDYSRQFLQLVSTSDYVRAVDKLQGASTQQALYACDTLSATILQRLLDKCPLGTADRARFALRVVSDLLIPQETYEGITTDVTGGDYNEARMFILVKLDRGAKRSGNPWAQAFYPEYRGTRRERVSKIAEAHQGLHKGWQAQVTLFSLGSHFTWRAAEETTGYYTTCGVFGRACLVAAGCLATTNRTRKCPGALNYVGIPSTPHPAYVPYSQRATRTPRSGDLFYIDNLAGTKAHVGVILTHAEGAGKWTWTTVEGGQDEGFTTKFYTRELRDAGRARIFPDGRQLIAWIDIDMFPWRNP